jgi:hypothetical protein
MPNLPLSLESSRQFFREFLPDPPRFERSPIGFQCERIAPSIAALIGELTQQSDLGKWLAHSVACIADPIA